MFERVVFVEFRREMGRKGFSFGVGIWRD